MQDSSVSEAETDTSDWTAEDYAANGWTASTNDDGSTSYAKSETVTKTVSSSSEESSETDITDDVSEDDSETDEVDTSESSTESSTSTSSSTTATSSVDTTGWTDEQYVEAGYVMDVDPDTGVVTWAEPTVSAGAPQGKAVDDYSDGVYEATA
jgi:TFIIF-interacting CTD phosphatase-like protein